MKSKTSEIIEIISAIAVVISLVFVGFEIRNSSEQTKLNTQAIRISAYQDLIGRIVEINKLDIEQARNFDALFTESSPSQQEMHDLDAFLWILFRHGDMAYFQFENNAISEQRMLSALGPLKGRLDEPYVQKRWDKIKANFVPSYRHYVDQLIINRKDSTGVPSPAQRADSQSQRR